MVDDYNTGVQYIIPVVFFKRFPKVGWLLLIAIIAFILELLLLLKIGGGKNNKNKQSINDLDWA